MPDTLIRDARVVFPGRTMTAGSVLVSDGRIAAIDPPADQLSADVACVNARSRLLTPGLIDIHTHGIGHHQYGASPEALRAGLEQVATFGTTCVLPTVVPMLGPGLLRQLEDLSAAARAGAVCVPGLHIEGPFVGIPGAACPTVPGDVGLLEEMIAACGGRVAAMSLSPETPGVLPVIERLVEHRIVPFVTHTRATPEQTEAAIAAGARHATHFYDVFPVPPETEPGARPVGAVEVFLGDRRTTVDFICDGCHVHPAAIRAAVAAKGWAGVALITDSNIGAGLPPGEYDTPWGYRVRVRPDDGARIASPEHPLHGQLAGSALTMNAGIANLIRWLDLSPAEIWAMGTLTPARIIGLSNKGAIEPGADADLVLWEDDMQAAITWVGGKMVSG
ncbi:MAG: amidohydrolase family protein [Phycisphaerae bacterium]|nr:amidohydrolase family protein [Phycisphaerae bacterium]